MTTRRQFLKTSAAAGALIANPFSAQTHPQLPPPMAGFSLTVLATNWGFPGSWDEYCGKAKTAGYDGCEIWWPLDEKERKRMFEALRKYDLKYGFLWGSGETEFVKHEQQFREVIGDIAKTKPLYINCHSGKDFFTADQKSKLIDYTVQLAGSSGIPIYHETHRGRACYSVPVTIELLEKNPGMRLTLDISHWCNVHESLLQDQGESIDTVLSRTDHIHARIGHAEGPQVTDPRAPEWESAVKAHLAWWDRIIGIKKQQGQPATILTEFGPPDYMPTTPYTRQPLANQWDINVYMMQTLRKRYF
jgi:sugar phosphate isomerase/epimerase